MQRALVFAVVAGCGPATIAPAAPPPAARAVLGPALPVEVFADDEAEITELVVDGDDVYWLAGSALRRSRAGVVETVSDPVAWFAVDHGEVFVLGDDTIARLDGTVLGTVANAERIAVGGDTIYVSADSPAVALSAHVGAPGKIYAIPRAGGVATVRVERAGAVVAIAADGDAVFWADGGDRGFVVEDERCADPALAQKAKCRDRSPRHGMIGRADATGVSQLADDVFFPIALGLAGDHVYWSAEDGEALVRVPREGGKLAVGLGGRGRAMAVDARGAAIVTISGMVVEVPADGAPARVRATDVDPLEPAIALADDAIYVADHARAQILRYPRGPARVTVLATPVGRFAELVLDGDDVYALDVDASEGRADRVLKVPKRGGHGEVVGTYGTRGAHLAVAGGEVAVLEPDRIFAGGRSFDLGEDAIAIATDGRDVYWLARNLGKVTATPIARDQRREAYQATRSIAVPMAWPRGTLVVDGDALEVAGETVGELGRVRAGRRVVIAAHVDDFAVRGDTFVTMGDDGLVVRPALTRLAPALDGDVDVALDARDAWLWRRPFDANAGELVRVPLAGGDAEVVIPSLARATIAADDDAVYLTEGSALLRLATR